MLNIEESIRFVSLRDVILTVRSKLLGANLKDSVEWLRKYLCSRDYPRRLSRNNGPMVFKFSETTGYSLADDDIVSSLFGVVLRHRSFFNESCFDNYGFDVEIINAFFHEKEIDINFSESLRREIKCEPVSGVLFVENKEEVNGQQNYSNCEVLFLKTFRDDDPLAMAIDIRNKEWANYNPEYVDSRIKQESVVTDLISRGISRKQAESIELVACPIKRR